MLRRVRSFKARTGRRLLGLPPSVRVGLQTFFGVLLILGICGPDVIWDALSLDPVFSSPANAAMLYVFGTSVTVGAGLTPLMMALHLGVGGVLGVSLGLLLDYIIFVANGFDYTPAPAKAAASVCLSGAAIFWLFCVRFRFRERELLWRYASTGMALLVAGTYSSHIGTPLQYYQHFIYFAGIASVTIVLSRTFMVPVTCGEVVRRSLADAMETCGLCIQGTLAVMTSEVGIDGMLCARSSTNELGVDQGLWKAGVEKVHQASKRASDALTWAAVYCPYAISEPEVYRQEVWFLAEEHHHLMVLLRAMLGSWMMVVYPLQTGQLDCSVPNRHAHAFRAVGDAVYDVLRALTDSLHGRASLRQVASLLHRMELVYDDLLNEVARDCAANIQVGRDGSTPVGAVLLSSLFTACSLCRRLAAAMPRALGCDEPRRSVAALSRHFSRKEEEVPLWDFSLMARRLVEEADHEPTPIGSVPPALSMILSSSMAICSRAVQEHASVTNKTVLGTITGDETTLSSKGEALTRRPPLNEETKKMALMEVQEQNTTTQLKPRWYKRLLGIIERRTGFKSTVLALATQGTATFLIIFGLAVNPSVAEATDHKLTWALFVAIGLLDSVVGGIVRKGVHRILGTAAGATLGLGIVYLSILFNGLSTTGSAGKIITMIAGVAICSGLAAVVAYRSRQVASGAALSSMVVINTVFASSHTDKLDLMIFPFRLGFTLLGVVIELAVTSTLFPVTARSKLHTSLQKALEELAVVIDTTAQGCLPQGEKSLTRKEIESFERDSVSDTAKSETALSRVSIQAVQLSAKDGLPVHANKTHTACSLKGWAAAAWRCVCRWMSPPKVQADQLHGHTKHARDSVFAVFGQPSEENRVRLLSSTSKQVDMVAQKVLDELLKIGGLMEDIPFESYPFRKVKRIPIHAVEEVLRLLRQLTNVAYSFTALLDTHDAGSVKLKAHHEETARTVSHQMYHVLLGLAGLLKGRVSLDSVVAMVENLERMTKTLLLGFVSETGSLTEHDYDTMLALAFLSRLLNASHIVHVLLIALLKTSYVDEEDLEQRIKDLSTTLDWGWEEQLMCSQSEAWASLQHSQLSIPEISLALAKSLNTQNIVDGQSIRKVA